MNLLASDQEIKELFKKYDLIMDQKKVELVDEVFTKKFLKDSGGKEEFIDKVKELPLETSKSLGKDVVNWKKGHKNEVILATLKSPSKNKGKHTSSGSEFIIIKEDGKLKIDGTMSDGN